MFLETPDLPKVALKVYALLLEGKSQSQVSRLLRRSRRMINYYTQQLLTSGVLTEVNDSEYVRGPHCNILDCKIGQINARGVTSPSPSDPPDRALVHHMKFRLNVIKEGDMEYLGELKDGVRIMRPFLRAYMTNYRGISRYSGKVPYRDGELTVEYETSDRTRSFYIYPPKLSLTAQQIKDEVHVKINTQVCLELARWIQTIGGWQLGLPECTDWKVHFGVDDPVDFGEIAGKLCAATADRKAWVSDSEGRKEWETSDANLVQIKLQMPQEVLTLRTTMTNLVENFKVMTQAIQEAQNSMAHLTELSAQIVKDRANQILNENGGMYR